MSRPARTPASTVYGPVPSRRLGYSLGVDLFPSKACSFDCVYCQLGKGGKKTAARKTYVPARRVLADLKKALAKGQRIDHITLSGSGEPTLHSGLGRLIRDIKKMTKIPVAVLTNASLLSLKEVRDDLRAADVVVPSLDAALAPVWRRVNRPLPSLDLDEIIDGLEAFRKSYKKQVWLEVMLVKGLNDGPGNIEALKKAISRVKPDKVQLNTVTRPPAERSAAALSPGELEDVRRRLGGRAEVIVDFRGKKQSASSRRLKEVLHGLIRRRPVTLEDMASSLGQSRDAVRELLDALLKEKKIATSPAGNRVYYRSVEER
jgi:wyosine [tRNA(Phe)-imidazoG37] synthetase (radical SAM superfamily)